MAVPTITGVTPSVGHTSGAGLVEIRGTGFQTWTVPEPSGSPSGPVWPTVEVLFGGVPCSEVAVISDTRLFARPPASPLPAAAPGFGEGSVDLTVRNIDSDGAQVGAETVTATAAFTYQRQQLAVESDLARLVRELLQQLKKQVIPNVSITTHIDYDADSSDMLDVVDVATLPALVVFGPLTQENRFYSVNGMLAGDFVGFESALRRAPDTDDLLFTFVGITDQKLEALNLQSALKQFFKRNRWLYLQRDPEDASLGSVKYDMELSSDGIGYSGGADQKSNLRSFSGSFVVRGFDHEDLAGFPGSDAVARTRQVTDDDPVTLASSQKDG